MLEMAYFAFVGTKQVILSGQDRPTCIFPTSNQKQDLLHLAHY